MRRVQEMRAGSIRVSAGTPDGTDPLFWTEFLDLRFAVVNQKGGVGKTTTAVNLSACIAAEGERVLLVDMDPQGNATTGAGIDKTAIETTMYDVLIGGAEMSSTIVQSHFPNLDVAPSTLDLAGADIELISMISRESRLKSALGAVEQDYDWVFIDCPPALGLLTINVLTASRYALIPIQCEFYALEGISQLLRTLELVRRELNPSLEIARVILTMFDYRTKLSQDVVREVRDYFGELVSPTVVPRNVRLSEAPSHGLPIIEYEPRSKGAESYSRLAAEVMRFGKERSR